MKFNKYLSIFAAGVIAAGTMTSCMADLDSEIIDPDVVELDANKMFTKCYASLIMEGNDGTADFEIDDAGKSTLLRNLYNCSVQTRQSVGGLMAVWSTQVIIRAQPRIRCYASSSTA